MRWATFQIPPATTERIGVVRGDEIYAMAAGPRLIDLLGDDGDRLAAAAAKTLAAQQRHAQIVGHANQTNVNPYEQWLDKEGVPVYRDYAVTDLRAIELGPWKRLGARAVLAQSPEDILDVHDRVDEIVGLFGRFIGQARAVRRLGSAAIDLCYVAAGRLDVTTHPFCSGVGPGDVRITTRYHPKRFYESFFGILHEAGHGIYEQGLPAEQFGTPLGSAASLGIHESQSRLWEHQVGRSRPYKSLIHVYSRTVVTTTRTV